MAAILTKDPDLDALPAETPRHVRTLIGRCLRRDPKMRQRDMGDVRLTLSETEDDHDDPVAGDRGRAGRSRWRVGLVGAALGLVLGAGLYAVLARQAPVETVADRSPRRSILIPAPIGGPRNILGIAISPDGSMVALGQEYGGDGLIELRRLDSFESTLIPDTEEGMFPFFSPDGKWLAFFDGDELRKVPVDGGPSSVICEAGVTLGGTWSDDGWIYFTHGESRLARVPTDGGEPENLNWRMPSDRTPSPVAAGCWSTTPPAAPPRAAGTWRRSRWCRQTAPSRRSSTTATLRVMWRAVTWSSCARDCSWPRPSISIASR